jgi:putative tryptophan/tyrosine transport system substrate-binding protein
MQFDQLGRCEFMTLLGSAAAAWPLAARAQQSSVPTVGILYGGTSDDFAYLLSSFRRGLCLSARSCT